MLLKLPVEKDDLIDSQVGKVIMFLINHKSELKENKAKCAKLIEK